MGAIDQIFMYTTQKTHLSINIQKSKHCNGKTKTLMLLFEKSIIESNAHSVVYFLFKKEGKENWIWVG